MVRAVRGGEEVKIPKRAGSYGTVRDLVDWVGRDAVPLLPGAAQGAIRNSCSTSTSRWPQSEENPVYYVQYAYHARVCSACSVSCRRKGSTHERDDRRSHVAAAGRAARESFDPASRLHYPELLENATRDLEPHQLAHYLRELAGDFLLIYYNAHTFIIDDVKLRNARLSLIAATRQVLENGLKLAGRIRARRKWNQKSGDSWRGMMHRRTLTRPTHLPVSGLGEFGFRSASWPRTTSISKRRSGGSSGLVGHGRFRVAGWRSVLRSRSAFIYSTDARRRG